MLRSRLVRRFAGLYIAAVAVVFSALTASLIVITRSDLEERLFRDLFRDTVLYSGLVTTADVNLERLQAEAQLLGERLSPKRFTVIDDTGRVVVDSTGEPGIFENQADQPEVRAAREGGTGRARRYDTLRDREFFHVALRMPLLDRKDWVIRASIPADEADAGLRSVPRAIGLAGLIGLATAIVAGLVLVRSFLWPVVRIATAASSLAAGERPGRLSAKRRDEIGDLSRAVNRTSDLIAKKVAQLTEERNGLEAILGAMSQGVVAVDERDMVFLANEAARQQLGLHRRDVGRLLDEVLRRFDLESMMGTRGERELRDDIRDRSFLVRSNPLPGRGRATVFVFQDVTELRRLERSRLDFVANVSHELRTPLTALKGYLETLRDGSVDGPVEEQRFLEISTRHADRLNQIVEDLLALSRIETRESRLPLAPVDLMAVLGNAASQVAPQLEIHKQKLERVVPSVPIWVQGDASLLTQVFANLLDNASKYSADGEIVRLVVRPGQEQVEVDIEDYGSGIPEDHLRRIFERFYRADPARSRELGGTGLGLAIVKHIVAAHRGEIRVQSQVGRGSTFTVSLRGEAG